ncbi:MAG: response regulator transcription factor [Gammaproteobacteria bacterium]|nr:response regulator transcription factor [Gammaproteobacteria bacterium]
MRVLVVEDEPALREQLVDRLRREGYAVDAAGDGEEGLYFGREYPIDLAVVDLGLPKLSGIEVIRTWRSEERAFPILILTARARWQEKVEGLEAGADDYVAKPFQIEEVLARMRALIRRASGIADSVVRCGEVALDTSSQEVTVQDRRLDLTAYEYRLLHYLMLNHGKVVSKSELTDHIYDEDADRDSNVIEVFVGRLRRKLDPENTIRPIETLRGRGYRFNPSPAA